jgi:hypothetical protein
MSAPFDLRGLEAEGWCRLRRVVPEEQIRTWRYQLYGIACGCGVIAPAYTHNMTAEKRAGELLGAALRPGRLDDVTLEYPFFLRPRAVNDWPAFAAFLADPRIQAVVRARLGTGARATETSLMVHQPGTRRGAWRAAGAFNAHLQPSLPSPYPRAARALVLLLLATDFSRENGGLLAVPRSHRRATNPSHEPREARVRTEKGETRLAGRAGDVLVLDGRLWHAVAPNASRLLRIGVAVELAPRRGAALAFPRMSPGVHRALPPCVRPWFAPWVGGG